MLPVGHGVQEGISPPAGFRKVLNAGHCWQKLSTFHILKMFVSLSLKGLVRKFWWEGMVQGWGGGKTFVGQGVWRRKE